MGDSIGGFSPILYNLSVPPSFDPNMDSISSGEVIAPGRTGTTSTSSTSTSTSSFHVTPDISPGSTLQAHETNWHLENNFPLPFSNKPYSQNGGIPSHSKVGQKKTAGHRRAISVVVTPSDYSSVLTPADFQAGPTARGRRSPTSGSAAKSKQLPLIKASKPSLSNPGAPQVRAVSCPIWPARLGSDAAYNKGALGQGGDGPAGMAGTVPAQSVPRPANVSLPVQEKFPEAGLSWQRPNPVSMKPAISLPSQPPLDNTKQPLRPYIRHNSAGHAMTPAAPMAEPDFGTSSTTDSVDSLLSPRGYAPSPASVQRGLARANSSSRRQAGAGLANSSNLDEANPSLEDIIAAAEKDENLVENLVEKLEADKAGEPTEVIQELRSLIKNNRVNKCRVIAAHGIPVLCSLLRRSSDNSLQEHAVTIVLNLSMSEEDCHEQVISCGGVDGLVSVLKSGNAAGRENAAMTLYTLSGPMDAKIAMYAAGAVKQLVKLLEEGTSLRGKKDAAVALYSLSHYEPCVKEIAECGGLTVLLTMCVEPEMEEKIMPVIFHMAKVPVGCQAIIDNDAIPVLVEVIETGSRRAKEDATGVLYLLGQFSVASLKIMRTEGAIPPLVALAEREKSKVREKARDLLHLIRGKGTSGVLTPVEMPMPPPAAAGGSRPLSRAAGALSRSSSSRR